MEVTHQGLPLWASLTFTLGFLAVLNGMGAAIDFIGALALQSLEDKED